MTTERPSTRAGGRELVAGSGKIPRNSKSGSPPLPGRGHRFFLARAPRRTFKNYFKILVGSSGAHQKSENVTRASGSPQTGHPGGDPCRRGSILRVLGATRPCSLVCSLAQAGRAGHPGTCCLNKEPHFPSGVPPKCPCSCPAPLPPVLRNRAAPSCGSSASPAVPLPHPAPNY